MWDRTEVLNQLFAAVGFKLPQVIKDAMSLLSFFALDFMRTLAHIECEGFHSSYLRGWTMRVFGLPALLVGAVFLRACYLRHRLNRRIQSSDQDNPHADAVGDANLDGTPYARAQVLDERVREQQRAYTSAAVAQTFAALYLVYPEICRAVFEVFGCIPLSSCVHVLAVDFSVKCGPGTLVAKLKWASGLVFIVFCLGLPMYFIFVQRLQDPRSAREAQVSQPIALSRLRAQHHAQRIHRSALAGTCVIPTT